MPTFRKYTEEETARMQTRRGRAVDLSEYVEALHDLSVGDIGEATLAAGEKKATVKRRLTLAAKQVGVSLRYRRSGDDRVIYEVVAG